LLQDIELQLQSFQLSSHLQFHQMQQMQDEDTPVEPKAVKGKKDTQASAAPAAVDDDVAKTARFGGYR
jgi:hypothetical protein